MNTLFKLKKFTYAVALLFCLLSCDDFVKVDPPRTDLVRSTVFESDATADAAMIDVYYQMKNTGFASGGPSSISFLTSLASDEYIQYSTSSVQDYQQFNDNNLQNTNTFVQSLWRDMYATIYRTNSIIEGLESSSSVTPLLKEQLKGEALFVRSLCNFYLSNLWGDIPLVTSTDYVSNNSPVFIEKANVMNRIVEDLTNAIDLLPSDYSSSNGERVRANKASAIALLARVYLYKGDWANAEVTATSVITQKTLYSLEPDLGSVFKTTSNEAIFQIWSQQTPRDRSTFYVYSFGPLFGAFRTSFISDFEASDLRRSKWIRLQDVEGVPFYYASKYFSNTNPPSDYSTVLRLAEQYLIRSEARIHLSKLIDGANDLDIVRNRAGLPNTLASSQNELLQAVLRERKYEFFTEWGHRWLDLIRYGEASTILGPLKTDWNDTDVNFPLPQIQIP